jgi:hypothetical protein
MLTLGPFGKRRRELGLKLGAKRIGEPTGGGLLAKKVSKGLPAGGAEALVDLAQRDGD